MNRLQVSSVALFFLLVLINTSVSAAPGIFNLVIDGTASMNNAQFGMQIDAAKEFVNACYSRSQTRPGQRADWIVVNFFGGPREYQGTRFINCSNLVEMRALLHWLDNKAHPRFVSKAIYNAIFNGTVEIKRKHAILPGTYMQTLIVITDGQDTASTSEAKRSVRGYYGSGNDQVFLYMIGVGADGKAGLREFESVADRTISIDQFSDLHNALFALLDLLGGDSSMEQQHRDFERILSHEIQQGAIRVEQLPNDRLLVRMTNATSFDIDSDQIKPEFHSTLNKIADIVNRYGKTRLDIAGHTDSTGSIDHNMGLSKRRALAVQYYLLQRGVAPERLTVNGYGQSQPVASNDTERGRALNRRVEITITPEQR